MIHTPYRRATHYCSHPFLGHLVRLLFLSAFFFSSLRFLLATKDQASTKISTPVPLGLSDSSGGHGGHCHMPPQRILNPQCPYQHVSSKESGLCQHTLGTGPKKSEHVEHNAHTTVAPRGLQHLKGLRWFLCTCCYGG